jgi:hypothetical protein
MNCVTGYEAMAVNSIALATAGSSLWTRLTTRVPREVTRRRIHDENAALMRRFGLDPEAVLGPAPERAPAVAVAEPVESTVGPESVGAADQAKTLVSA